MGRTDLIARGWTTRLTKLIAAAREDLVICSPYIGRTGTDLVCTHLPSSLRNSGRLRFLTDLSPLNVVQRSTDPAALTAVLESLPGAAIRHLPRLHAKVYIADSRMAIIGSANLTAGGLFQNHEYGVEVSDSALVQRIREDIVGYSELGATVAYDVLVRYSAIAEELRQFDAQQRSSASAIIRRHFQQTVRRAEDELVRARLSGGAVHTVFERTIEFLLRREGPLSTQQLHPMIAAIHPDLCDHTVDRVIDGKHYGKKWKHAVRTAQQHLKKRAIIREHGGVWQLTEDRLIARASEPVQSGTAATATGVVRGLDTYYADGQERFEIHIGKAESLRLPAQDGQRVPITLVITGRHYRAGIRSTSRCKYVWICPDLIDAAGRATKLSYVLLDAGLVKNERVELAVLADVVTLSAKRNSPLERAK